MPPPEPCPGCGARFPVTEGPTHPYLESSPGCWATYGEVLAREYGDIRYGRLHQLTVDAYAVQHPGRPARQTTRSLALHLMSLCYILERGLDPGAARKFLKETADTGGPFDWLTPPETRGEITVESVRDAESPDEHLRRVRAWADSAWAAWSRHHPRVERWMEGLVP